MTNERLAELIPHIESALEDGYPLQLKGDDLRFLLEAIKARLSHEPDDEPIPHLNKLVAGCQCSGCVRLTQKSGEGQ